MNSSTREAEGQPPEHKKRPRRSVGPSRRWQNCAGALYAMNGRRHDAEAPMLRRQSIDLAELRMPDEQQHQGGGRPAARAQKTPPPAEYASRCRNTREIQIRLQKGNTEIQSRIPRNFIPWVFRGYSLGIPWVFLAKKKQNPTGKNQETKPPRLVLVLRRTTHKRREHSCEHDGVG